MWVVAKIKKSELNIFQKQLIEKFDSNVKFYYPKIQEHKYVRNKLKKIEKLVLENYIFCYHNKFENVKSIAEVKFVKGLEYFLKGYWQNQNEIIKFINYCKNCENKEGYLTSAFFKSIISKKAEFASGPFTNMMFEILERKKNKLKILIGNLVTTISDNKNYLYWPV